MVNIKPWALWFVLSLAMMTGFFQNLESAHGAPSRSEIQKEINIFLQKDQAAVASPEHSSRIRLQSSDASLDKSAVETVILIHGLYSSPAYLQELEDAYFEKGFHVFNIRLPGHFEKTAEALDSTKALEFKNRFAEIITLAKKVSTQFHFAGHSTGALLALDFARKNPQEVRSLLLLAPALQVDSWTLSIVQFATNHGLSWKDLWFVKKAPGTIYRSTWVALEVHQLCQEMGLPLENRDDWVKPLTNLKVLMVNTEVETSVDLFTNLAFASHLSTAQPLFFEHVLIPRSNWVLHNKVGYTLKGQPTFVGARIKSFLNLL